jgi:predicted secreted hydrolase
LVLFAVALMCALSRARSGAQEYQRALPGYRFEFPRDYFNHEEYRTEWWYYTGNLQAADGHRFGFELTFFRVGVSRKASSDPWFVHDLWMAHLALSDIGGRQFYHEERLNRAGPGFAGVDAQSGLVWNGNWQVRIGEHEEELRGIAAKFSVALQLEPLKPPVIQGQDGVSRKAEGTGDASHYFSLTRLKTSGEIDVDGKKYVVEGTSWMDHEFFSGGLAADESGWDWLSVQLEDGTELMLYRMRHRDGSIDAASSGSFVDSGGRTEFLSSQDFVMTPESDTWTSPATKAAYPVRWHVSIPRLRIELELTTPLRSQEMTGRFGPSYWEGAVDGKGSRAGASIAGAGYLEMTGYAQPGRQVLPQ